MRATASIEGLPHESLRVGKVSFDPRSPGLIKRRGRHQGVQYPFGVSANISSNHSAHLPFLSALAVSMQKPDGTARQQDCSDLSESQSNYKTLSNPWPECQRRATSWSGGSAI